MYSSQENLIWHIEKYRKSRGLSYLELSSRLHIPYTTLTETLRGKRVPRIDTVDMLADAMGLDTWELFLPPGVKSKEMATGAGQEKRPDGAGKEKKANGAKNEKRPDSTAGKEKGPDGTEDELLESVRDLPEKKKELLKMYLECLEEIG